MASFSVVNNIASANAQSNLITTSAGLNRALTRLSSGLRINGGGDDAAGLAVANTYRNEQSILNQGIRNANDGLSDLQVKDGALSNISTLLDRLATLSMTDVNDAQDALDEVVAAIDTLGDVQSTVGTLSNRLQFAINLATSQSINKRAAESRIRDANVAEESANMTKFNILSQSGIAALAQANQSTASVLALLR